MVDFPIAMLAYRSVCSIEKKHSKINWTSIQKSWYLRKKTNGWNLTMMVSKSNLPLSRGLCSSSTLKFSSWWLNQPIWKICSSNWIISPGRDENKKSLKPPPSLRGVHIHPESPPDALQRQTRGTVERGSNLLGPALSIFDNHEGSNEMYPLDAG